MAVPSFPLSARVWWNRSVGAAVPPITPPDIAAMPCNLQFSGKVPQLATANYGYIWLLVPAHTDVRAAVCYGVGFGTFDLVEVPTGSSRWYYILDVDDVSKGFTGEYRCCTLVKTPVVNGGLNLWPIPIP